MALLEGLHAGADRGEEDRARPVPRVAEERGYYGFLAADRLDREYTIQHVAIEAAPRSSPPCSRAARSRSPRNSTPGRHGERAPPVVVGDPPDEQSGAQGRRPGGLRWGWHDRAIITLGKTDQLNDLEVRFPILYRELIETNARDNKLDPDWVYGVLRQESAFHDRRPPEAGALGLMQLMPRTGRLTAQRIRLPIAGTHAILQVDNNVKLGTSYLRQVLDQYHGHQTLATASYNAGPHRVRQWLPDNGALEAPAWVETIPFNETRNYVKNVMGFTAIYGYRLNGLLTRLRERMPEVPVWRETQAASGT